MGKEFPRNVLSILAALAVALPTVMVLFADPAASQTQVVTCKTNSQTDQPFPNLNVTQVVIKRLDPGVTISKSGKWYFLSQPGDILVEVTVQNKGTAATTAGDGAGDGSFVVRLEDVRPDGTTVTLGDRSVPNLAAGASSTALKYVAEGYNSTGEHKLRASADVTKKIKESCTSTVPNENVFRENDNVGNQSVLLTSKADLRITSLVAKSEVRAFNVETASSKIAFNATISNGGNHKAFNAESGPTGFLALFKLNGDEAPCKKTTNTVTIKELLPGATKQVEVKCEIAKLTGDFNVTVDIDSAGKVVESNEANNRFTRVFHLRIADLVSNVTGISGTTDENAVPEFGSMTFTATVRNAGDANATTDDDKTFAWFVYLDEKKDTAANMLANFSTKLAPSASTQATFTVRPLERDLLPGAHKIFVVADSDRVGDTSKGKVIESNTTNNEFVLDFEVARFQLNLTAQGVTKKVSPGIEVSYPFNLTNEGNAKDEVAFTLQGAGVTARVELANGTEITGQLDVPENETVPLVLVVSVPKDAAENSTINVTVLAESTVPKASAGDELTFRTDVGPDVVAPTIVKVKPAGDVVGAGGIVELTITDNVAVASVRYAIGTGPTQTAAVATDAADTYRITPPTAQGPFTLSVTALDAKNNQATQTYSLEVDTAPPNITSIGVVEAAARSEDGVNPNTPITVTAEITDANMKNATVRVGPMEAVMRQKAGPLWESVGMRAPSTPGEFRIVVYAFDEGGNSRRAVEDLDRVRVKGVDLALSVPTGDPKNPREGDVVRISAPVENRGLATATGVRVQLLIDGVVVDETTLTIPAGAAQIAVLEWEAVAGVHTYNVIVDPDNEFTETNELNNRVFRGTEGSIATLFPQARLFTKEAAENDFPDLMVRYLWVFLLGLAAIVVGAAAFFVKPA